MLKNILLILFFSPLLMWSQHTISGTFKPAKDYKIAILYKSTPMELIYANHSNIDSLGHFSIPLRDNTEKGLYKLVYASPQEEFNFDVFYTNKNIKLTFSLEEGVKFNNSKNNKLWQSYKKSMSMIKDSIIKFHDNLKADKNDFKTLINIKKQTQLEFENAANNKLVKQFIQANKSYYPSNFEDKTTYRKNLKAHYFDYLDFSNAHLLNSDVLTEKALSYVFSYVDFKNATASYKENIDTLISKIETQKTFTSSVLQLLWNEFSRDNEVIANYITNNYLLKLAKAENKTQLIKQLLLVKNTSLNAKAPDFNITETKTLHHLNDNDTYIVVFWSSTCGHCLSELPQLHKLIDNNIKVIAIGLEDEIENWKEAIKKFPKFTHVYGDKKWDNEIGNSYNVNSTPSYFVLNKNKIITAKPYNVKALKPILAK